MSEHVAPPTLVIGVFNTHCNYNCTFCANRLHKPENKMWTLGDIQALDTLWKGVKLANIGGVGEMSIVPDFEELIAYFQARGVKVCFTSNGYMLDPEMIRKYDNIDDIVISLHSLKPETYDRITGTKGRLARVVQHIRELAVKPRCYRLIVVSVVTNANVKESEDLARFVAEIGADELRFLPLASVQLVGLSQYDDDIALQEIPENMACIERAKEIVGQTGARTTTILKTEDREAVVRRMMPKCPNPWGEVIITIDGDILPCCFIHHVFGNIYDKPWEQIWNSPEYNQFRAEVKAGTSELCLKNCKNWG